MKRIKLPVLNKDKKKNNDKLHTFQRAVRKQGILAICTIILTFILLFAMTTAWYSNVAQTSGLIFETASWGFSGEIQVMDQTIQAAPGTSGVVPFSITNESDGIVSIEVTVSKALMSEELQKRIYFYVDTAMEQNEEQVQRVYLSSTNGYSYLLLSQEQLAITEESYNDAPVRWEWVYDMLGYYVQGRLNADETSVTVERYLRPIVYDYNAATFEDDGAGGKLKTVDGETTVEEFLTEISQTDGYEGTIDTQKSVDGYYPVSVGEDGSGVWVYLCTFSEIELGIGFDTEFAQKSAEERSFTATLNFTAQNLPSNVVTADSAETLQEALTDTSIDVVKLEQDIELEEPLSLPAGNSAVLDLNNHNISGSSDTLITVNSNANLSLSNGTIQGNNGAEQEAVRAIGAVVSLNNVVVQDVASAVVIVDNLGECDSRIKINNCELTAAQTAVMLQGNGSASTAKSQLIVESSKISGGYIGISGQGSASGTKQYWGTDVQVINSEIEGKWAGIYHPQQKSTLTVSAGSQIKGYTGIAVKGGDVTIIDSTVQGTGASQEPAAASGGWTDTGDGVYVEATYPWAANVVIKGSSNISSVYRYAVELYTTDSGGPGSIKIYDGTFSSDVTEYYVTQ